MAENIAAGLGRNLERAPRDSRRDRAREAGHLHPVADSRQDYTVEKDGLRFAATHVLAEFWGARHLDNVDVIEDAICSAAEAAGATVLHVHLHQFSSAGGVSGVAVLAESHISIHTWPEREFAAVDIFMCGACDPYKAVPALRRALAPTSMQISEHKRGLFR
ncbi:MAG: adenosylmethionine decarboxylase [Rhodospirillales bacterium]